MKMREAARIKQILEKEVGTVTKLFTEFKETGSKEKLEVLDKQTDKLDKMNKLAESILNSNDNIRNMLSMAELESLAAEGDPA